MVTVAIAFLVAGERLWTLPDPLTRIARRWTATGCWLWSGFYLFILMGPEVPVEWAKMTTRLLNLILVLGIILLQEQRRKLMRLSEIPDKGVRNVPC